MEMTMHARAGAASEREEGRAYLLDMIQELAKLARGLGEHPTAIHLEAILEATHAARKETPF